MILYHGSNVAVEVPRLLTPDRKLDFGAGFYVTSSMAQAVRWSELTVLRRKTGAPTVSCYTFAEEKLKTLKVLAFESADAAWLKYTARNRMASGVGDDYDIVIGPVADDQTMPVISAYYAGVYDEEETLKRLLPQKLKDQYAFKTESAIALLAFKEVLKP